MYFGENNDSAVLKSFNIGHVITYSTVFSICSQYVEFYKVLPQSKSQTSLYFSGIHMQKVLILSSYMSNVPAGQKNPGISIP